jgi:hypothetical protein
MGKPTSAKASNAADAAHKKLLALEAQNSRLKQAWSCVLGHIADMLRLFAFPPFTISADLL